MRGVPRWILVSATAAPVLLIGGWTVAAGLQRGFDSTTQTISALARLGATDRWIMTVALGVAALPLPVTGTSASHGIAAGVAFVALAVWPALSFERGGSARPWGLRPPVAGTAAVVLVGLVLWFAVALRDGSGVGLAERCAAGAQSLWPLAVALSAVWAGRQSISVSGAGTPSAQPARDSG